MASSKKQEHRGWKDEDSVVEIGQSSACHFFYFAEILIGSLKNGCYASIVIEAPDGDDFVFESIFPGFVQCNHTIAKHYPSKM